MKVEARLGNLILITENESESDLLDLVFGGEVGYDGIIGHGSVECRLSDGYATHYLLIKSDARRGAEKERE